jgi:tRNA G18 (ribose-2'-O)-methylase SpoU
MGDLIEITDPADPRLGDYRDLRDVALRKSLEASEGLFMAEGAKVVRRAAVGGYTARSFLMAPRWVSELSDVLERFDAPVYVMSEAMVESITGYHVHRGALASFMRPALPAADALLATVTGERRRVAVLEDLVDDGNIGLIFRNAAALGIDLILVTEQAADPLYRRAIKTSMGNVFSVPWTRVRGLEDALSVLRADGYVPVALTLTDSSITLDELVAKDLPRLAFVFGTEGAGVNPKTEQQVDHCVRIPMEPGVDSLNVAAAAAVTFYATR